MKLAAVLRTIFGPDFVMRTSTRTESFAVGEFPEKLAFLFAPARYKVLYGGRGAAKSWGMARALLIEGAQHKLRILCAREFQNSISESVHQLLSDQIVKLKLQAHYIVNEKKIEGRNGTKFRFFGLRKQFNEVASYEGIDRCWVEEAATTSKASWEKLIPTIRKDGSEIWVSFNPMLDTDETYQRFVINTPPGAVVVKLNYYDNPWFPEVLKNELQHLKLKDEDAFLNIWEGMCRRTLTGAIFAKEMRDAELQGRITKVPVERGVPVDTIWDIGRRDMTSIWFRQRVGYEYRYVDFYENCGYDGTHYLEELQKRGYLYGMHHLPHDAAHKKFTAPLSFEQQARNVLGNDKIEIGDAASDLDKINAGRTLFPRCAFDEVNCADGLQHLRHYRYRVDEHTNQYSQSPLHDEHSHAADAFMYSALASGAPRARPKLELDAPKVRRPVLVLGDLNSGQWMG